MSPARGNDPGAGSRWASAPELALAALLSLGYLLSFGPRSPLHGPFEVFAQDSAFLWDALVRDRIYPFNPQSHLLHHTLLEKGHELWLVIFEPGRMASWLYLKTVAASSGFAFLVALRWLLCELSVPRGRRLLLLGLSGLSLSAGFHFAAFETHCLALPVLVLYLVALVRLRDARNRGPRDGLLLGGALVVLGWLRVDLFRFAVASAALLPLPGLRSRRRALAACLAGVAVLGAGGSAVLAARYFDEPLAGSFTTVLERGERRDLQSRLGRMANLTPSKAWTVARATLFYGVLMPVEGRPADRSFLSPPTYVVDLKHSGKGTRPTTRLFLEPARNLFGNGLSLLATLGWTWLLGSAWVHGLRRIRAGDPLHVAIAAQTILGWLTYTWFNPDEPFLFVAEFMPLWIVLIADDCRARGRRHTIAMGVVLALVATHNAFAFHLPFG